MLCGELASQANRAVRTFAGIGIENVLSISAEDALALGGNILRHAQGDGESLSRAQHGIGNAGIAAGSVEQSFAGNQLPAAARSFTEPPGLCHSALPKSVTPGR